MPVQSPVASKGVQLVEVSDSHEGQRIDNFLLRLLKGVPKSRVYRLLRRGEVRVNKKRVKPEYRLQNGDVVRIPPVRMAERRGPQSVSEGLQAHLQQSILYEDTALLVVNKPSGLAVHGGSGVSLGLIEALRLMRPDARFLELVHRLDRDTSGCIMVAKKRSMLRYLHELLRQKGGVDKRYQALAAGKWPNRKQLVSASLIKNSLQSGERMIKVSEEGKKSLTEFSVLQRYSGTTLMQCKPITGRTHQIRVHAQYAGHPLLGDEKYGDDKANRHHRKLGLKRLFLHAASLRFRLPDQEQQLLVEAPLSAELQAHLHCLERG